MCALTLRPLTDADRPLLEAWLGQDYILKWYHNPETWLYEIDNRRGSFAWIRHFIVMDGPVPVGFCQYYDCYDAGESWYQVARPGHTYSIDYLIGRREYLGRGFGKAIVALLTDRLRSAEGARRIIVQPEGENLPSVGVLLANGYTYDAPRDWYCKELNQPPPDKADEG